MAWCKLSAKSPAYMDGGVLGRRIGVETIEPGINRAWLRYAENRRVIITR